MKKTVFLIDYTEDKGKTWKNASVIKSEGGIYGRVTLKDDVTKEVKTLSAEQTKMRVLIN